MTQITLRCSAVRVLTLLVTLSPCHLVTLSPARADDPPDKDLVVRWPAKADAAGQVFDGSQFIPLAARPDIGSTRVVRGGGWNSPGRLCRATHRFGLPEVQQCDFVGFRVVLVPAGR